MSRRSSSPTVAWLTFDERDRGAGTQTYTTIRLDRSGRVQVKVRDGNRRIPPQVTVTPWHGDGIPTLGDLARTLVATCARLGHPALPRLLSASVHGLIPTRDYALLPGSLFDEHAGPERRFDWRATIDDDLTAALRLEPALAWATAVETAGTPEHEAFMQEAAGIGSGYTDWLIELAAAQRKGTGTRLGELVLGAMPRQVAEDIERILDQREPPDELYLRTITRHLFLPGITIGFVFSMQIIGLATFLGPVLGPLFAAVSRRATDAGTASYDTTVVGVTITVWSLLLLFAAFARERKPAAAGIRYARLCRAGSLLPIGSVFFAAASTFDGPTAAWVAIAVGIAGGVIGFVAALVVLADPETKVPIEPRGRKDQRTPQPLPQPSSSGPWPPPQGR